MVSGAAQGIGAASATLFAERGARTAILDVDTKAGKRRAAEICARGGDAFFLRCDAGRPKELTRAVRTALKRLKRLDALINNVGIGSRAPFASRPRAQWDRVIAVNLSAAYLAAQAAAPALGKARGSIVNISSTRALMSESDTEPYSASKGGLLALTHSLAVTLAGKVRVNAVCPGWIDTSAWHYGQKKAELTPRDHAQHPAGRVGRPEDIAHACLFLCSPEAGFITGQKLVVDGGMTVKMIYEE